MGWSRTAASLYRTLLLAYPAEFRREYGGEMAQLFEDRLQNEPPLPLWFDAIADIGMTAPREHYYVLMTDLRHAARMMINAPAFTAIALCVIAIGIAATTTVFSLVNAILLRSMPFGDAGKLVYLWSPNRNFKGVPDEMGPNVPDFYDWETLSRSFSRIALFRQAGANLVSGGSANRAGAAFVTADFFPTLQASPELGRTIDSEDDRPGKEQVAVISDRLWRSRFGSAPDILGKRIQLDRRRYTVIGVMPKAFGFPSQGDVPYEHSEGNQTDIWLPAAYTAAQKASRTNFASADAIGRLRPGISSAKAETELAAIEARLQPLYPAMWRGWSALVRPLVLTIVGPVQTMLWLLLGAVALVLLIAIGNVASLQIARLSGRAHEMGIRTALGAERARIVRQLLTESLLLTCIGGALAIALSYGAVHLLVRLNPGEIPRFDSATLDGRVLLVALALSTGAGVLSGLAPAVIASRVSVNELLRHNAKWGMVGGSYRGRSALIAVEVALSVILLAGAGLMIRSYVKLAAVNPGFSGATLTFSVPLDERYNKPETRAAFYKNFLEKLKHIPGSRYAGASSSLPLTHSESLAFAEIGGVGMTKQMVEDRWVTPDYRKALGTPLLRGRDFTEQDFNKPVVIVNDRFAQVYFHSGDPIGRQLRVGIGALSWSPWSTVVGVIGNIRHNSLEEASQPQILEPADHADNFAIQFAGSIQPIVNDARAALRSLDPTLTLDNIETMSDRIRDSNARRTFQTGLLSAFAAIAVLLALAGLYGLISYAVKQRTSEIAVRMALGAKRAHILGLLAFQGLGVTGLGLLIGVAGALAVTRAISAWLFGVMPNDPITVLAVPLLILVVASLACLFPAWNATRVDPVQALRQE